VPDARLTFHDETEHVRALHTASWTFTDQGRDGLRIEGSEHWQLDIRAIKAEMAQRGLRRWTVRLSETKPDLATFFDRYVEGLERHPVTGGFGRWLNPLGRWDWWDLGGRFDGRITGEHRRHGRAASRITSGPNRGRDVLGNLEAARVPCGWRIDGGCGHRLERALEQSTQRRLASLNCTRYG
jgi:hypothetical protein